MVDIFQEVDEALKQERVARIWSEYKSTIILAIIVLIGSTAATSFYQSWNLKKNQTETAALLQALEADDTQGALAEFADDTRRGHSVIALMGKAAMMSEENPVEAAKTYTQIAKNKAAPDDFRDLARILAVRHGAGGITAEQADKLLAPLLKDSKSPFQFHAKLEAASIKAHKENDYQGAITLLEPMLSNPLIPDGVRSTAKALSHVYAQKVQ